MKDYIELRRLTPENGGYRYKLAKQSYEDIYNNAMSKGKTKLDRYYFLGGNPITLENKDFPQLIQNEYVVSTKADGERFLLMIGNKTNIEDRRIFFIDRNMDFWDFIYNGEYLPSISNMPNCLLDGELMIWGDVSKSRELGIIRIDQKSTQKPLVVYSTFDILYGPTNPTFQSQMEDKVIPIERLEKLIDRSKLKLVMGASGAMTGPKGGYRWPWKKRYTVLETMILEDKSPLSLYNHLEELFGFKIVLSPFKFLRDVMKESDPEKYMIQEFVKELNYQYPEIPNNLKNMTDGLILTPANKEYIQGSWNFCGNELYKWKPRGKLTIDLQIGNKVNIKNLPKGVIAYQALGRDRDKLKKIGYILSETKLIKDNIVECKWLYQKKSKILYFQVYKHRDDKVSPNALITIRSVIAAIINPFPIKMLQEVYTKGINKNTYKILDPRFKIRCGLKSNPCLMLTDKYISDLTKLINIFKNTQNGELETRIRLPKISGKSYFNCLVSKLSNTDIAPGSDITPIVRKYTDNNIRSSEAVVGDYLVMEDIIKKEDINRISMNQTNVMKLAGYNIESIHTVLSKEIPISINKIIPKKYRYQKRFELDPLPLSPWGKTPSVLWRADITEYRDSKKSWKDARSNYELYPWTSIELEYAPGDQENNMWSYYEDTTNIHEKKKILHDIVKLFNLKVNSIDEGSVKLALDSRVRRLNIVNTDFIVRDHCRLLQWILQLLF